MQPEWSGFWGDFLNRYKLKNIVSDIDLVSNRKIEEICHKIYNNYDVFSLKWDKTRIKLIQEIENLPGVHLQTSRVKDIESLLRKIIIKRYEWMMNPDNKYSKLSEDNYDKIITDIVGIRLIISYRGAWKDLHRAIVNRFPYKENEQYSEDGLIPVEESKDFIAEMPHAYYAYGDDISIFKSEYVKPILRESGYRSVHYIVCFSGIYVELQTRTIYDEAWSDCDHNFVYKHEDNISYSALKSLSDVLCRYTNTCNELGDLMRTIYYDDTIIEKNKKYLVSKEDTITQIDKLIDRYSKAQELLVQFKANISLKGENDDK